MKKITLAAAVLAVSASFAAPSFAMENPVAERRAKIEKALQAQKYASYDRRTPTVRTTTFGTKPQKNTKTQKNLKRSDKIIKRLFGNRPGPSGR